jgi:hypothetical protein
MTSEADIDEARRAYVKYLFAHGAAPGDLTQGILDGEHDAHHGVQIALVAIRHARAHPSQGAQS